MYLVTLAVLMQSANA